MHLICVSILNLKLFTECQEVTHYFVTNIRLANVSVSFVLLRDVFPINPKKTIEIINSLECIFIKPSYESFIHLNLSFQLFSKTQKKTTLNLGACGLGIYLA